MSPSEQVLIDDTVALCAIPSVTGNEGACADEVERRLRALGALPVQRIGNSVVARRGAGPLVLFVGHLDTVPGEPGVRVEGDRIVGLGASDMKGGLAVMLALAAMEPGSYAHGFVFYDREEGPWAESGLGPVLESVPWLRQAALAFCLEPSDNVIQVGCLGTLHAKVTFRGRAAHSARPWQGRNAIHAAGPFLSRLGERAPVDVWKDGHLFREVMSATLAAGGGARNVIPDRFVLNVNYRFAPGRSNEAAEAEVRAVAAGAEVEIVECAPAGTVVTGSPLLQRYVALTGSRVEAKQAWTDVARLGAAGIDAVNLGPGHVAQAHRAGEYLETRRLVESYENFARFLAG